MMETKVEIFYDKTIELQKKINEWYKVNEIAEDQVLQVNSFINPNSGLLYYIVTYVA